MIIFVNLVVTLIRIIEWAIVIDCVLSFIPNDSLYDIRRILGTVTGPILEPFRRIQERIMPGFMVDFSPIFAWIVLGIIERIVVTIALR